MKRILPILVIILAFSACISTTEGINGGQASKAKAAGTQPPQDNKKTQSSPASTTAMMPKNATEQSTGMAAAISLGAAYKCDYTFLGGQGEAWMYGGKFLSKTNVEQNTVNSLSDGLWAYTWMDGQAVGMKFNLSEVGNISGEPDIPENAKYADVKDMTERATDVNCVPDAFADGRFTPPADVEFQDMGETLRSMREAERRMPDGVTTADPCSMCLMIPDQQAKHKCLVNCEPD